MVKCYNLCNDDLRRQLIVKIHVQNMSIFRAAQELNIKYATAKAINAVYLKENRIKKKQHYDTRKPKMLNLSRLIHDASSAAYSPSP